MKNIYLKLLENIQMRSYIIKTIFKLVIIVSLVIAIRADAGMLMMGGGTPVVEGEWVWANDHTPSSGDLHHTYDGTNFEGHLIVAPVGRTKITKIKSYWYDVSTSGTVSMCIYVYPAKNGNLGGGTATLPGTSSGYIGIETGALNISVTAGTTYTIVYSPSNSLLNFTYVASGNYQYWDNTYDGTCQTVSDAGSDSGWTMVMGAYFE
jgi:hypothetical protein